MESGPAASGEARPERLEREHGLDPRVEDSDQTRTEIPPLKYFCPPFVPIHSLHDDDDDDMMVFFFFVSFRSRALG